MKIIHLSDLHLGKRVNEFSMIEDQKFILKQILGIIDEEKPVAVLIAGDVYDKAVPSAEAVQLFDDFLVGLSKRNTQVMVISGNHDSPERIAFGGRLMEKSGIHLSPVYEGKIASVSLEDEYGTVEFYLLPFVKPVHMRRFFPEQEIETYTDAIGTALCQVEKEAGIRKVLLTHQFVTGAARSDSEEISVGGSDNVDASVFDVFDYVALGHIHRPQRIEKDTIRYCGTPLKYSFSEAGHEKSVTVVELGAEDVQIRTIPLVPKHDMRKIRGSYEEVMAKSFYQDMDTEDYLHITLTEEEDIPDVVNKLRVVYPNLMKVEYDNTRTRNHQVVEAMEQVEMLSPMELFQIFYESQNNQGMTEEQQQVMDEIMEKIWEGNL